MMVGISEAVMGFGHHAHFRHRGRRVYWKNRRQLLQHGEVAMPTPARPIPIGGNGCKHARVIRPVEPDADERRKCLAAGKAWEDLWLCLSCGWVSCSDPSSGRPADQHYAETDHPIAAPLAGPPGVRWCFVHRRFV